MRFPAVMANRYMLLARRGEKLMFKALTKGITNHEVLHLSLSVLIF